MSAIWVSFVVLSCMGLREENVGLQVCGFIVFVVCGNRQRGEIQRNEWVSVFHVSRLSCGESF